MKIRVDGREMEAAAGSTVAAAIGKGLCGMGVCFECRVSIDRMPQVRACMTVCREGMEVHTDAGRTGGYTCGPRPARRSFDVVVVGAGPAGMAAASAAAGQGAAVAVVDGSVSPGVRGWRDAFHTAPVERLFHTEVVDVPAPGVLLCGTGEIGFRKLIVATGARERFLPFPGWTLPRVAGAGGLQALVKSGLPVADLRVVVAGSGPLLPAVAAYLRERGAQVPVVAEQAPWSRVARFAVSLARYPAKLAEAVRLRPAGYLTGCWPVAVDEEGVTLRRGSRTWKEPCDRLACGFGLVPNLELARLLGCRIERGFVAVDEWQRTSAENVWCAGEAVAIGGVDLALVTGEIAGYAAVGRPDRARRLFAARRRALGFASALVEAFALREELRTLAAPETIVCRCEQVPLGSLRGRSGWRDAKLHTRCGMGACQGRVCGEAAEFLLGWGPEAVRPPLFPAAVENLAGWGGGKRKTGGEGL